jgi:hypothetical protein
MASATKIIIINYLIPFHMALARSTRLSVFQMAIIMEDYNSISRNNENKKQGNISIRNIKILGRRKK